MNLNEFYIARKLISEVFGKIMLPVTIFSGNLKKKEVTLCNFAANNFSLIDNKKQKKTKNKKMFC